MKDSKKKQHRKFSQDLWARIQNVVGEIKQDIASPVAAFDVDGTLWNGDIAELFFSYQIQHRLLPGLPREPWAHYFNLMAEGEEDALMWLAQVNEGQNIADVKKWAKNCFMTNMKHMEFFDDQRRFIDLLLENNFQIYCISGSVEWAVGPVAEYFNILPQNVIGMKTKIHDGIITGEPVLPMTWRQGKVDALLKATGGKRPQICSGNTMGDLALLESATHCGLAVASKTQKEGLINSEQNLQLRAKEKGWLTHCF